MKEQLIEDMIQLLRDLDRWDGDLVLSDEAWDTRSGLPKLTQELFDRKLELQRRRNCILATVADAEVIPDGTYFKDDLDGGRLVKKESAIDPEATVVTKADQERLLKELDVPIPGRLGQKCSYCDGPMVHYRLSGYKCVDQNCEANREGN